MTGFLQAMRSLRKAPSFAAVAIGSLALGIGANVTVFSIVREMILDDLSARNPDRLARVVGLEASYTTYRQLRGAAAFEDVAYYRHFGDRIWHNGSHNEIVWRLETSANFFDLLGVGAYSGRLYSQGDEGRDLAVSSYRFWRQRLHGGPRAVGQSIRLAGKLYTLAGILPRSYRSIYGHGVSPELYLCDSANTNPQDRLYGLFGRLRPGATFEQTRQALVAAAQSLAVPLPERPIVELRPMTGLRAYTRGTGDDRLFLLFFLTLFGVSGILALLACSNVAGLLMVRTLHRRKELAIRKSLGATRIQILRPLLAEGLVLVACGAGLGLLLDAFLRYRLSGLQWPSAYGIPVEFHFQSDPSLFLYAGLASLAALLFSSVLPALPGADAELGLALKQGQPSFSARHWDMRNGFVLVQVVLSMVLLTISSLFTRSLLFLVFAGPGFDAAHTLIVAVHPLPGRYDSSAWDLRRRPRDRVHDVPGVESISSAGTLPLMGEVPATVLRRQGDPLSLTRHVHVMGVGEDYFRTLRIPMIRGRDLKLTDRTRAPVPAIVNRTLAQDVFAAEDAIGQHLLIGREKETIVEIVGVAADFKMRTLGEAAAPAVFTPDFNAQFLVRVAGNPALWIEPMRTAAGRVDSTAALDVRPLGQAVAGAMFPMRVAAGFLGSLSSLGLVLSLIGLYASVSFSVGQRTHEFGIRSTLGATGRKIVWTALRDGVVLLAFGVGAGVLLALIAIPPLAGLFPDGFNPWQAAPLLAVVLLLFTTGVGAIWVPARRAAGADPAIALRDE